MWSRQQLPGPLSVGDHCNRALVQRTQYEGVAIRRTTLHGNEQRARSGMARVIHHIDDRRIQCRALSNFESAQEIVKLHG